MPSSPTDDPPSQVEDNFLFNSQHSYLDLQESYIKLLPWVESVTVNYCLFLQVLPLSTNNGRWNGRTYQWRLVETDPKDPPLDIDLQAITWKKCQQDIVDHIAKDHATLKDYLNRANACAKTNWFGSINGDNKYGAHEGGGVLLKDHSQFLNFSTHAYKAYPQNIKIQIDMYLPVDVSGISLKSTRVLVQVANQDNILAYS
jgi:hypothetical protein